MKTFLTLVALALLALKLAALTAHAATQTITNVTVTTTNGFVLHTNVVTVLLPETCLNYGQDIYGRQQLVCGYKFFAGTFEQQFSEDGGRTWKKDASRTPNPFTVPRDMTQIGIWLWNTTTDGRWGGRVIKKRQLRIIVVTP